MSCSAASKVLRPKLPRIDTVESPYVGEVVFAFERAAGAPYILARLRWPDLAESISPHNPEWTTQRSMFYMLYDSSGEWVSEEYAREFAESWGATWPQSDEPCATTEIPSPPFQRGLRLLNGVDP